MDAPVSQPRHTLLPILGQSRAVLVGCHDDAIRSHGVQPTALADRLAQTLVLADLGMAFDEASVEVLTDEGKPGDILDGVRRAAAAASDVLLFYYVGTGRRHQQSALGRSGSDSWIPMVADIVQDSPATRVVVLLDGERVSALVPHFRRIRPVSSTGVPRTLSLLAMDTQMFFDTEHGRVPAGDPFTRTLINGLQGGVGAGPAVLDLVTLRNAIEAQFAETRYYVENEYIGAPATLILCGGDEIALGVNPAAELGAGSQRSLYSLPLNAEVVHQREQW